MWKTAEVTAPEDAEPASASLLNGIYTACLHLPALLRHCFCMGAVLHVSAGQLIPKEHGAKAMRTHDKRQPGSHTGHRHDEDVGHER